MNREQVSAKGEARRWTSADDYLGAMARRRTARRSRAEKPRTQSDAPRLLLSTLPFLALMAGLALLAVGIFVTAWPVSHAERAPAAPQREVGTAPKGWFQEAERQFR